MMSLEEVGVAEFFVGRSIFITGASGFMGKVLVEKLLRSCPGIAKIYILLRPGRTGSIQEKMDKITSYELFDRLKSERPGDLESKLVPIEGDMTELGLGITDEDRALLIKEVSIVYHVAATVRFNQALKQAVIINVRGTRELCKLVLDIRTHTPNTIMLHVSTTYSNCDRKVVDECLYPSHADWRRSIQIAEDLEEHTLQILCAKYMNGAPNTYTFTKSLAEHVVNDLCGGGGNTIIMRPSIVVSSAVEPMPGWIDNFNGIVGLLVATGTGVIRISFVDQDIESDYIFVDVAIKAMIVATWKQFVDKRAANSDESEVAVYNCSSNDMVKLSFGKLATMAKDINWDIPLTDTIWSPSSAHTNNMALYYINFMLFQLVPAIILDGLFKIFVIKKRSLIEVQRKIYTATIALVYFGRNEWKFINHKLLGLEDALPSDEMDTFAFHIESVDIPEFFKKSLWGAKKYLLKDDMTKIDRDVLRTRILYYVDLAVKAVFYSWLIWFVLIKVDIM